MHPAISTSYIVPAIFLNPVLFLISLNTILSRVLPPIIVDAVKQPPPYSTFGPSAQHPHLNIHASEKLCWSYTFLIVCAQLAAFGKISDCREEGKVEVRMKEERIKAEADARNEGGKAFHMNGNGYATRAVEHDWEPPKKEDREAGRLAPDPTLWHLEANDEDSTKASDSEFIP